MTPTQMNQYFQTLQIQWNSFVKVLRKQIQDSYKAVQSEICSGVIGSKKAVAAVIDTGFFGKFILIGLNLHDEKIEELMNNLETNLLYLPNGCFNGKCSANKGTLLKELQNLEELGLDNASIFYLKPVTLSIDLVSSKLDIEPEQVLQNLKEFVISAGECSKKYPTKTLRLDLKIGVLIIRSSRDSLSAGDIEFTPSTSMMSKPNQNVIQSGIDQAKSKFERINMQDIYDSQDQYIPSGQPSSIGTQRQVQETLSIVSQSIVPKNPMEQFGSFESGRQTIMEPKNQAVQVVSSSNQAEDNDYNCDEALTQVKARSNFKKYTQQHQRTQQSIKKELSENRSNSNIRASTKLMEPVLASQRKVKDNGTAISLTRPTTKEVEISGPSAANSRKNIQLSNQTMDYDKEVMALPAPVDIGSETNAQPLALKTNVEEGFGPFNYESFKESESNIKVTVNKSEKKATEIREAKVLKIDLRAEQLEVSRSHSRSPFTKEEFEMDYQIIPPEYIDQSVNVDNGNAFITERRSQTSQMSRKKSNPSQFSGSYGQYGKRIKAKRIADKQKEAANDFLQTNLKILTDDVAQNSAMMNNTHIAIYNKQKKMNDYTRTAIVYTSDLTERPKGSSPSTAAMKSRSTAHSVMSFMQSRGVDENVDPLENLGNKMKSKTTYVTQPDPISLEILDKKRMSIKSQQQNQRYQKKTRGQFAWAGNDRQKDSSPYSLAERQLQMTKSQHFQGQLDSRNFKNNEYTEFMHVSDSVKKVYDNQPTALSLHENFSDLIQHAHVQYTNGRESESQWRSDKESRGEMKHNSIDGDMINRRKSHQESYQPVLTNSFKVHPLEAMNVPKYKRQTLMNDLLEMQEQQKSKMTASRQTSTQLIKNQSLISKHKSLTNYNSILPWDKRRNPLMGIQYSESPLDKLLSSNKNLQYQINLVAPNKQLKIEDPDRKSIRQKGSKSSIMFGNAQKGFATSSNASNKPFPFNKQILLAQPEVDAHLLSSQQRRDRENSELIVDTQMERYKALLAIKENEKKRDNVNFNRKLQLLKEQERRQKLNLLKKNTENQMYVKLQIQQKRQREIIEKEKDIIESDKDYLCFVTGSQNYDNQLKIQDENSQQINNVYGKEARELVQYRKEMKGKESTQEKKYNHQMIEENKKVNQIEEYHQKQRKQLIQSMNRNLWSQQIEMNQRKMELGYNYIS